MTLTSLSEDRYRDVLAACAVRYIAMSDPEKELHEFALEFGQKVPYLPLMKLNRWLGYIQGVLIERGYTTVTAERDWTRPLFRPLDFGEDIVSHANR